MRTACSHIDSVECRHHVELIFCSTALTTGCSRTKTSWRIYLEAANIEQYDLVKGTEKRLGIG